MSYGVLPDTYDADAYAEAVNVAQSMYALPYRHCVSTDDQLLLHIGRYAMG